MDTKNIFGLRPTVLRAPEPTSGPLTGRTIVPGYGPGCSAARDRVLRGRSARPEQGEHAGSRSIG